MFYKFLIFREKSRESRSPTTTRCSMKAKGRWLLTSLAAGLLLAAPLGAEGPPAGDPRRGEALYVGTVSFEKGGAPCLGCHGIAGAGLGKAAGASYGPDLTATWEGFGDEGIEEALASMPFPSMEELYKGRPLSDKERADLTAYLQEVSGRETPRVEGTLLAEAGAGLGVLFLVVGIFGTRRMRAANDLTDTTRRDEGGEP
jgi:mono/diheme cytochrome c family protein